MTLKNGVINSFLVIGSTLITWLVMELVFPNILNKIPLTMYNGLQEGYRVLGQTSKESVIPKNYIALMGDSYAQGQGDWLKEVLKTHRYRFTTPDYHSGHLIYRNTGKDVISFGAGGAGSLRAIVAKPISQYLHINSLWRFELNPPEIILIYFYEGNDVYDNSHNIVVRYNNLGYDRKAFYDPGYFKEFIQETVLEGEPLYQDQSPLRHFLFARFLGKGLQNGKNEIKRGIKKLKKLFNFKEEIIKTQNLRFIKASLAVTDKPPSQPLTEIKLKGKETILPEPLEAPPFDLNPEELKQGVYVFEQAILYMAEFFNESTINIIYIPSPLASYHLTSEWVAYKGFSGETKVTRSSRVRETSGKTCRQIFKVAEKHGYGFLDVRPWVWGASENQMLHGPRDYTHFNKAGHMALADAITTGIFSDQRSNVPPGCAA